MQNIYIHINKNEYIAVNIFEPKQKPKGIVFILHGLAGFKEEDYLLEVAHIFLKHKITVINYDARFSLGDSSGDLKKSCFSNFIDDFDIVLSWAKKQKFYQEPFFIAGHSLGAGTALFRAIQEPNHIKGIVCLSPVYNGEKLLLSYQKERPDFLKKWQEEKYIFRQRPDNPSKKGFISYDHMIDAQKYQLEKETHNITAPTLIITGDSDISSTIEINQTLFDSLSSKKELHIIKNAKHTYKTDENKKALTLLIDNWLKKINK